MMAIPVDADYLVRGYNGKQLLVETWHRGESSKDMEVDVWRTRIKRGEATHIEVVDRHAYKTITVY